MVGTRGNEFYDLGIMHPPGWFPDSHNPALVRWWNGHAWTEHTKPIVAQPIAMPPAPMMPATPAAHVAPAAPAPRPAPPPLPPTAMLSTTQKQIAAAEARLAELQEELESVEEALEIQSFGFYRPKYGFHSSDEYGERLKTLREEQKATIKRGDATHCDTEWKIGGSAAEGKKMVERMSKLMLRAFNGECDAATAKARYDNVISLEQRITKSYDEINKLGASNRICVTQAYCDMKLAELHLVHEHREKLQAEKEEQKRIREELKEQQKARDEIERAQAEAEREEEKNRKALEKARSELAASAASEAQHKKLEELVSRLENELKDAIDRKAKAVARAQLTKSGHVYVLSNVGSFGDGVYKIGLTRRLDPYERVDELGDASVPFAFDVHAIIYAEDAPALENALHKEFAHRRVNMVNHRKEYFRVSLEDIRVAVEKHHGLVTFVLTAEAEEWRKTRALLDAAKEEA